MSLSRHRPLVHSAMTCLWCVLLTAMVGTVPRSAGAESEGAVERLESGPVLDLAHLDPAWTDTLQALARPEAIEAPFTERRWFSLRKQPVELTGELRRSPESGLSLRYLEPEERLLIVDAQGVLVRNAAGRSRALKSDPRGPQMEAWLLPILRFDLAALSARFEIRGAREGERWRLDFTPRPADPPSESGRVSVSGRSEIVQRIEFSRGTKQRVEVVLGEPRRGVVFEAEELRRYFR